MERLSPKGGGESDGQPLGRAGSVQDVANAAVFLFSGAAALITGRAIVVDGGWEHVRGMMVLPYPQAVLEPASVRGRARL
jgi:peroxisomal 2,4-dienoyl-CoA reductase